MSGSGGGGGYEYQAIATAYIAVHILLQKRLDWIKNLNDLPIAVAEETDGPGDDIRITLQDEITIELQAKHGLQKNKLWEPIVKLVRGLHNNSSLYGILLTDSTASGVIRNDLRTDIIRLGAGRTDNLKAITQEFLQKLTEENICPREDLFSRLSIRILDLDDGLQNSEAASKHLSQILEDQNQANTAWKLLCREGLDLLVKRGRRDAIGWARYLSNHSIQLKTGSENSLVILEVYRKWIQESSETFSIPGIRDGFSMQYDWIQLEVVKTIEKEAPFNAAFIPEVSSSRSVVIGNSGGGKSTLTKYLAYRLSSLGKKVLRVRLSSIRKLLATHTFNDSILINSTNKLSLTLKKAKFALGEPDYLIADGLDECEEDCFMIAEELENWAAGHLSTKIIVTTRTGYETGILGGWEFLKLLPLKRQDIIKFAQRLLEDSLKVETFLKWLETRNNISLASTNPLILGFLVQIYQDNPQEIPNRSMLYEKIITLAYKRPLQDRKSSKVDEEIAYKILNIIGLKILENPNLSKRKLKELISQKISNDFSIKLFDARQEVEKVLFFWINNRILEDVKIGTDDLIIFTHKTINSYVAACCICERDPQDFNRWFMKNYQNPLWKEPILFLSNLGWAEEMISYLLRCDAYNKISVNNIYMAIEIMNELSEPIPNLFTLTIPHFQSFLISSDYDLVFQMAEALLTLSSEFKALLHEVSRPLLEHFQSSTRLAAIRLSIMSENNVDLDIIKKTIDYLVEQIDENIEQHSHKYSIKFKTNPFPPRKLMGGFQSDTLVECFRILVDKEIGNELFHRLNLVVTQGHINYKSNKALRAIIDAKQAQLRAEGDVKTYQKFSSLRGQLWGNPFKILKDFSNNIRERAEELLKEIKYRQRDDHPDRFFLKTIIRMFNSSLDINILSEIIAFPLLGILLEGMSYHEVLVEDWESISKNPDSDALEIVIRGAISFLTIDYQQLAAEAYKLLDNITWNDNLDEIEAALEYPEGDQKNDLIWGYQKLLEIRTRGNDTISSYIPTKLPIDPKWDCLHELIDYRCALEDALTHPSNFIRHNAILILFYMIGKEEIIVSLQKKGIDDVIFDDE